MFYLSVDRDTTSRYGKHYFRRKYADTIGESKSADVPWLGQPSAKVPRRIINAFPDDRFAFVLSSFRRLLNPYGQFTPIIF